MSQSIVKDGVFKKQVYGLSDIANIFSMLGLTRFGTQSYLPLAVSGSFEGASRPVNPRTLALFIEDDGTVSMLRNGTNGLRNGVYYSYCETNDDGDIINYRPTNTRYQPKFLPNHTPVNIGRAGEGVVVGLAAPNAGGGPQLFIALTSGTANQELHAGCVLTDMTPSIDLMYTIIPAIVGDYAYIFALNTDGLHFYVWRLALSDIRANTSVSPELMSGWNITRPWSTNLTNQSLITLAAAATSLNNPGKESYLSSSVSGLTIDSPYQSGIILNASANPGTNQLRILVGAEHYIADGVKLVENRTYWAFSFVVDVVAKTVTPDAGQSLPLTTTYSGTTLGFSGPQYVDRNVFDGGGNGNVVCSSVYSIAKQKLYSYVTPNFGSDGFRVASFTPQQTNKYDALRFSRRVTPVSSQVMPALYGSVVGGEIGHPQLLPNGYLALYGLYNNVPGQTNYGYVQSKLGADGFAYNTPSGNFTGYAPSIDRKALPNYAAVAQGISEINAAGTVTYSPAQFYTGRLSGAQYLDKDLTPTNSNIINIADGVIADLQAKVLAGSGLSGVKSAETSVYIPQNPNIPGLVCVTAIDGANDAYSVIGSFTLSARTGTITTASYSNVQYLNKIAITTGSSAGSARQIVKYAVGSTYGVHIYEGTDCWFLSIGTVWTATYVGNSSTMVWRAVIAKSSPGVVTGTVANRDFAYPIVNQVPFALPGVGFGYIDGALGSALGLTTLAFRPIGKTLAEYTAWNDNTTSKILVSQAVAQGWIVYFTEQIPLLANGQEYLAPLATIDLTTIKANPANSVFHTYAAVVNGVVQYKLSETPLTESATQIYIGDVVTNATQVESTAIEKTTVFAGKHLSPRRRGQSIPVSSGNPASGSGEYLW